MARGTFANIRLINKLVSKPGPRTLYIPTGEEMDIFDAAELYAKQGRNLIVISGKEYGSGSSRDWAAKGPWKLGVKGRSHFYHSFVSIRMWIVWAGVSNEFWFELEWFTAVIAESFERIHRSNLVGMGIIPLQFINGQNASSLGLTGLENYTINIPDDVQPGQNIEIKVYADTFAVHLSVGIYSWYLLIQDWSLSWSFFAAIPNLSKTTWKFYLFGFHELFGIVSRFVAILWDLLGYFEILVHYSLDIPKFLKT